MRPSLRRVLATAGAALMVSLCGFVGSSAWAAGEATIDHAEAKDGQIRVLYSVPQPDGAKPDLASVAVRIDGRPVEAVAEPAERATKAERVRRTAILAIDTSRSMSGTRFGKAKEAARAFLDAAPEDVRVGIVAFAGDVEVVHPPDRNRAAAADVLDTLTLTLQTRLYDGVRTAVEAAGRDGQRSVLVLSDGRDTSRTMLDAVAAEIKAADVRVDAIALGEANGDNAPLEALAAAGSGKVIGADDPASLTGLFNEQADALARQILVTVPVPEELAGEEGSLEVSLDAGEVTYTDRAFLSFGQVAQPATDSPPQPVPGPGVAVSEPMLVGALVALGVGVLGVLAAAMGVFSKGKEDDPLSSIAAYTRGGATPKAGRRGPSNGTGNASVGQTALSAAQRALASNKGLEAALGVRLDGAGVSLKPAEWLLLHAGIALAIALLTFVATASILLTLLLLLAGLVGPWVYLGLRKSRRLRRFNAQLPETLQLMSGSLSAGLSLVQSMDTVIKEGSDPIAGEFRRALAETRLGVDVEDALDSAAARMESDDFAWVVMAIRIQRSVGGNLAELLLKVAGTMREREYLRRQVKTLSAEGRLSGWILGALPPGMLAYMLVTNPAYLAPMLHTPLGWLMMGGGVVLMAVGAFWMSRVVKVEV